MNFLILGKTYAKSWIVLLSTNQFFDVTACSIAHAKTHFFRSRCKYDLSPKMACFGMKRYDFSLKFGMKMV